MVNLICDETLTNLVRKLRKSTPNATMQQTFMYIPTVQKKKKKIEENLLE